METDGRNEVMATMARWAREQEGGWDGAVAIDLSDPELFSCTAAMFGGREHMAKAYPAHLRQLEQAAEHGAPRAPGTVAGADNLVMIRDLACTTSFAGAVADVSLAHSSPSILLALSILVNGAIVHKQEGRASDTSFATISCRIDQNIPEDACVEAVFWAFCSDGGFGTPVSFVVGCETFATPVDPVRASSVQHPVLNPVQPKPVNAEFAGKPSGRPADRAPRDVNVCYARTPLYPEVIDYRYAEMRKEGNQQMLLDVRGNVALEEGFTCSKIDSVYAALNLMGGGGIVHLRKDLVDYVHIEPEKHGFSYELPTDWSNQIPDSVMAGDRRYAVDVHITFECEEAAGSCTLFVSSEEPVTPDSHHFTSVPFVRLFWGCLEENTLVSMGDGTKRPIRDVRPGDRIMSVGGRDRVSVRDVVRGSEDRLWCLTTEERGALYLTENHPVFTRSGMKRAVDVLCADELLTDDGRWLHVRFHFPVEGSFTVYNLVLEGDDRFFAAGYAVGDNAAQGRLARERDELRSDAPPELLEEADRWAREFGAELTDAAKRH